MNNTNTKGLIFSLLLIFSVACQKSEPASVDYVETKPPSGLTAAVYRGGKWGFINPKGDSLTPFAFDWVTPFAYGRATVRVGRTYTCIDTNGLMQSGFPFMPAPLIFKNGLAAYSKRDAWGFISLDGKIKIEPHYKSVEPFSEGLAAVTLRENGKTAYIDTGGKTAFPQLFQWGGAFSGGLAPVYLKNAYGFIDKRGAFKIEPQFDFAAPFREGLAAVERDGKWGFVNEKGQTRIPLTYDYAHSFSNGRALVKVGDAYGYIDTTGKMVVECRYKKALPYGSGVAVVCEDKLWGVIDANGKTVVEPQFEDVADSRIEYLGGLKFDFVVKLAGGVFIEGLAAVKRDGKWGYIDTKGAVILPFQYEQAGAFHRKY